MSSPSIETIRAEHQREAVGPEIYSLLISLTRVVATRYPAQIYSGATEWSEDALQELTHTWVVERLMRGDLSLMIGSSASTDALRRQLATSLRQLIINKRRRDSAGNLYRRALAMLRKAPRFKQTSEASPHRANWTLADRVEESVSTLSLRELTRVAAELSDEDLAVVRYGPHALKSSPILREHALEAFLAHLLDGAKGSLTLERIAEVMQHRFGLVRERDVALEVELASAESVELHVETTAIAESILSQLSGNSKQALAHLAEQAWDVVAASKTSGLTRSAVSAAGQELAALTAEYADSEDQANDVLNAVCESLFKERAG